MRMMLLAASILAASPAAAAVFAIDGGFGPGSATRSTATGLDFLDLTITRGNVSDIDAELVPGGLFDGFRRATTEEVGAFWLDAGVTPTRDGVGPYVFNSDPAYVAAVSALMELVGLTEASGSFDFSEGFTAEPSGLLQRSAGLGRGFNRDTGVFDQAAATINDERDPELAFSGDNIGNYLVRAFDVPAPAMLALFGLGAGALVLRRR